MNTILIIDMSDLEKWFSDGLGGYAYGVYSPFLFGHNVKGLFYARRQATEAGG